MKRLTKRYKDGSYTFNAPLAEITDRLASYEDAEQQGLLVRLPCKAGDTVYCIRANKYGKGRYVKENKCYAIEYSEHGFVLFTTKRDILGNTVFLTYEEAEAALAKEVGNAGE